mgnify:CR=1 FL=1|jgi:hypothetical protein
MGNCLLETCTGTKCDTYTHDDDCINCMYFVHHITSNDIGSPQSCMNCKNSQLLYYKNDDGTFTSIKKREIIRCLINEEVFGGRNICSLYEEE